MSTTMKEEDVITLTFSKEKDTKNTVKYTEDGDAPKVGSLYVKKDAIAAIGNPAKLKAVITADDA